jgi:hypothetical protein
VKTIIEDMLEGLATPVTKSREKRMDKRGKSALTFLITQGRNTF